MSEAISNRPADLRPVGSEALRRETIAPAKPRPEPLHERQDRDAVDGRGSATHGPAPLEQRLAAFLDGDGTLDDLLGAPQFPLALREADALLRDLAAAAGGAASTADEGEDAAMSALLGEPAVGAAAQEPNAALTLDDARVFGEAAEALQVHLDARATFRAGAARLMKT